MAVFPNLMDDWGTSYDRLKAEQQALRIMKKRPKLKKNNCKKRLKILII